MIQQGKTANRGDRFLVLYNQLVDYFRARVEADEWVTFSALVKEISIGNSAVRYHKRQLLKYGELRNAIVHSKTYPDVSIADPHDDTLADFERITEAILAPTKLATQFQKNIRVFDGDEPLVDALRYMKANNFSQVVVRADGRLRLLTTEGVTEWLASQADALFLQVKDFKPLSRPFLQLLSQPDSCRVAQTHEAHGVATAVCGSKRLVDVRRICCYAPFATPSGGNAGT